MAFGSQIVNMEKNADNSHLRRCEEVELWAKDVYDWCSRRYGRENIIGFQVHLDETSPHIHALIVPVGVRPKVDANVSCGLQNLGKTGMNMEKY